MHLMTEAERIADEAKLRRLAAEQDEATLESLRAAGVPEHLHDGLVLYVNHHVQPGNFLQKVLANNLLGAFERGDAEALAGLGALVSWLYNEAPASCWRSEEAVDAWLAREVRVDAWVDSETGTDRAPDRYTAQERETVDRMRDHCRRTWGLGAGDSVFATACDTHAMKYRDRSGRKGEASTDLRKAEWWEAMASCVRRGTPDPRAGRTSGPTSYEPLPAHGPMDW